MKPIQQPTLMRSLFDTVITTRTGVVTVAIILVLLSLGGVVYAESAKTAAYGEGSEVAFITTATLTPSLTPEGTLTFTPTFTTSPSDTPAATSTPAATRTTPPTATAAPTETAAVTEAVTEAMTEAATEEATDIPTTAATISETATSATQEMIALSPIAATTSTPTSEANATPTMTPTPAEGTTASDAGTLDTASGTWFILAIVIVAVLGGLFFRANTSGQKE